jgi:hypothetical protein
MKKIKFVIALFCWMPNVYGGLSDQFTLLMKDFPSAIDCEIISGPVEKKMNRGQQGKEWRVSRGVYCFKISIENGHSHSIGEAMTFVSRLPEVYMPGLEIVSDAKENGFALYKDIGGAAGHGGRTYCNMIGLDLGVLLHELGHAIEQEVRHCKPDLLERWLTEGVNGDKVSVSAYGNSNHWEDMAEFGKTFAICLKTDQLAELKKLSPNRFRIWRDCLVQVNTNLRPSHDPPGFSPPVNAVPAILPLSNKQSIQGKIK